MLLTLASAKGSPGVTTTGLALAAAGVMDEAAAAAPVLLVEVDPAGGDLECWCGPHGEPGLLAAVTEVRDRASGERLRVHAAEVVAGVEAVVAPTTAASVDAALRASTTGFAAALGDLGGIVVVDCGRWATSGPSELDMLATEASLTCVVCRPTLASIEHTRSLVSVLHGSVRRLAAIVVGGTRPYGPDEVSAALGVPVAGVLPWDARGVAMLIERGAGRPWQRSALGVAATELLHSVTYMGSAHRAGRRSG